MAHRKSPARLHKGRRVVHFQQLASQKNNSPPATNLAWDVLAELEAAITGRVVVPGDPDYDKDRQESNPAFQRFPKVIVY